MPRPCPLSTSRPAQRPAEERLPLVPDARHISSHTPTLSVHYGVTIEWRNTRAMSNTPARLPLRRTRHTHHYAFQRHVFPPQRSAIDAEIR